MKPAQALVAAACFLLPIAFVVGGQQLIQPSARTGVGTLYFYYAPC